MSKQQSVSPEDVKAFVLGYLAKTLEESGRTLEGDLPDDFDLLLEGVVDSLGMLTLTAEVESHFGQEIDFEDIDPEEMTILGPLCDFIVKALNQTIADQR